nr:hypothetical protein [Agrobacterium sp. rho-8.1]
SERTYKGHHRNKSTPTSSEKSENRQSIDFVESFWGFYREADPAHQIEPDHLNLERKRQCQIDPSLRLPPELNPVGWVSPCPLPSKDWLDP